MLRRLGDVGFLATAPVLYFAQALVVVRLLGVQQAALYMTVTGIAGFALGIVGGSFGTAVVGHVRSGHPVRELLRLRAALAFTCGAIVASLAWSESAQGAALLAAAGVLLEMGNPQFVLIAAGRVRLSASVDIARTGLTIAIAMVLRRHVTADAMLAMNLCSSVVVFTLMWKLFSRAPKPEREAAPQSMPGLVLARAVLPVAALGVLPKILDSGAVVLFYRLKTAGVCADCGLYPLASRFANIVPLAASIVLTYCLAKGVRVARGLATVMMFVVLMAVGWVGGAHHGIEMLLRALSRDAVLVPARLVFFATAVAGMGVTFATLQVGLVQRERATLRMFALGVFLCGVLVLAGEGVTRWTRLS